MKIDRLALKAAVNKSLANNEATHAKQLKDWEAFLIEHKARWMDTYGPTWITAVSKIEGAIRAGKPVTTDMVPDRYSAVYTEPDNSRHYSDGRPPKPRAVYTPDPELVALNEVLDIIVDDEVTVNDLNRLGITAKTLREAVLKLDTRQKMKS